MNLKFFKINIVMEGVEPQNYTMAAESSCDMIVRILECYSVNPDLENRNIRISVRPA